MHRHGALNGTAARQRVSRQRCRALLHHRGALEAGSTAGRDVPGVQALGAFKPRGVTPWDPGGAKVALGKSSYLRYGEISDCDS